MYLKRGHLSNDTYNFHHLDILDGSVKLIAGDSKAHIVIILSEFFRRFAFPKLRNESANAVVNRNTGYSKEIIII